MLDLSDACLTSIEFEIFVELANLNYVLQFCNAIASTPEGRNLKLLRDLAFEASLDQGRNEEQNFRDEMYLRGNAHVIKEVEEAAHYVEIDLYSHGIEKGRTEEQSKWTSSGYGHCCFSPITIFSDASIQTDLNSEPLITTMCNASSQTVLLPDPVPGC